MRNGQPAPAPSRGRGGRETPRSWLCVLRGVEIALVWADITPTARVGQLVRVRALKTNTARAVDALRTRAAAERVVPLSPHQAVLRRRREPRPRRRILSR